MKTISATSIAKTLNQAKFNPKKSKSLRIIVDVGNYNYYLTQAQVLIEDAKKGQAKPTILKAIQMLTLAILVFEEKE